MKIIAGFRLQSWGYTSPLAKGINFFQKGKLPDSIIAFPQDYMLSVNEMLQVSYVARFFSVFFVDFKFVQVGQILGRKMNISVQAFSKYG